MDLLQYLQYRAGGGSDGPIRWEFSSVKGWEAAPAPAQIGKRLVEGLFRTELPASSANLANNLMHWGYGISWAAAFGIVAGSAASPRVRWGPVFGSAVWLAAYVVLPPTGLYEAIWKYDVKTLGNDWAGHLLYGTATGAALRALWRARPS